MENKQTAVEWLNQKLQSECLIDMSDELFNQAKAMEKEQILNACHHGVDYDKSPYKNAEEYYNKTYGK
jgi:hypothetical protein